MRLATISGFKDHGVLSPWLANVYLHQLDIAFPDLDVRVVRYADDALLMARTPSMAQKALERAKEVIEWGPERRWVRLPQDTRDDKVGELMVHLVRLTTRRYAAEQISNQEASQEIFLWLDLSLVMTGQAVSGIMVSEDDASASTPHGVSPARRAAA